MKLKKNIKTNEIRIKLLEMESKDPNNKKIAELKLRLAESEKLESLSDGVERAVDKMEYIDKNCSPYSDESLELDKKLGDVFMSIFRVLSEATYRKIFEMNIYPELSDIEDAIEYFKNEEDYEKCAKLQNIISTRYNTNL